VTSVAIVATTTTIIWEVKTQQLDGRRHGALDIHTQRHLRRLRKGPPA
jgi:hypothetical protein